MKWELLQLDTAPRVSTHCLPVVIVSDQISQAFSLHSCKLTPSNQKLEVGMAGKQGKAKNAHTHVKLGPVQGNLLGMTPEHPYTRL